ncbi:MAG: hypothetical protein ACTHMM_21175 [Agriterribacter sp.]
MAFNVSSLPDFVNQKGEIIGRALGTPKTIKLIAIQPDNKGKASLNNLSTTITLQNGETCGFNASGDDQITQRILEAPLVKIQKSFCIKTLEKTFLAERVKKGANNWDDTEFVEFILDHVNKAIAIELEKGVWQAEKETVPANNLEYWDGFLTILSEEAGVIDLSGSTASGSIINTINAVYAAIPSAVLDQPDVAILTGIDTFRTYAQALVAANLYHFSVTPENAQNFELVIPGTATKLYGVAGLNGTKAIVAGQLSNFVFGTDLLSDTDQEFQLWYSQDNFEIRYHAAFRAGTQCRFPDQIVYNQSA